jgi:hypothetical protein
MDELKIVNLLVGSIVFIRVICGIHRLAFRSGEIRG